MRRLTHTLTVILLAMTCSGDVPDSLGLPAPSEPAVVVNLPDTLNLKSQVQLLSEEVPENNWPWISAALVGVLSALVNIILGIQQRKANEKALGAQLSAAKESTLTQFKATLASSNRQQWIDKLRDLTSQLLAEATMLQVEFSKNVPNAESVESRLSRFVYLRSTIAMHLNEKKDEQFALIEAIRGVEAILESDNVTKKAQELRMAEEKVIQAGRSLFGIHWKKIKALT